MSSDAKCMLTNEKNPRFSLRNGDEQAGKFTIQMNQIIIARFSLLNYFKYPTYNSVNVTVVMLHYKNKELDCIE